MRSRHKWHCVLIVWLIDWVIALCTNLPCLFVAIELKVCHSVTPITAWEVAGPQQTTVWRKVLTPPVSDNFDPGWNLNNQLTAEQNKKFKLMLTGRAKAYSSSCSQLLITVSLSPPISSRLLWGTALWCPRVQVSLNLENRDLDRRNLRSMLKISYAACPCLSELVSAQFALATCLAARNHQKNPQNPLFWHSRSLNLAPIESQCTTSY